MPHVSGDAFGGRVHARAVGVEKVRIDACEVDDDVRKIAVAPLVAQRGFRLGDFPEGTIAAVADREERRVPPPLVRVQGGRRQRGAGPVR